MKKNLFLALTIFAVANLQAATVRIYNKSKGNVFARINESKTITGRPNFKLIKPGSSAFYNSDFDKIKKVTFIAVAGHKNISMEKSKLIDYINKTFKDTYNLMSARKGYMWIKPGRRKPRRATKYGPPAIVIHDNVKDKEIKIPVSPGVATVAVPEIKTFTYNLGDDYIAPLTTEARIDYYGLNKAKRIVKKKKFLGIF